jgi:FG-GAP-like repeat/Bacterial Ig domain
MITRIEILACLSILSVTVLLSGCDGCVPPKEYQAPIPLCEPQIVECSVDGDCSSDAKCIDTKCIRSIDPATYQFSKTISHISTVQVPAEFGEDCCFDLNGDGQNNDMAGHILTQLVPTYGENWLATETINGLIEKGDLLYLLEYRLPEDGCGPSQIWIYNGKGDLDHDGIVDQPVDDRATGEGVFQVDPLDFASGFGPGAQFNSAYLEGGTLYAEGGKIPLTVQIPSGPVLSIMAEGVIIESKIRIDDDSVVTVDGEKKMRKVTISSIDTIDENGNVECGAKAGGYVPLQNIVEQIDIFAKDCPCAGIDPDEPVMVQEVRDGEFQASCVQTPVDSMENCSIPVDNNVCHSLTMLCALIETGVVNQTCDVSSGEEGVDGTTALDSISFALRFCIDGATLAGEPLAPDFIAIDDYIESPVFRSIIRLDVLFNDTDLANGRPTIIDIFQDDEAGGDGNPDNGGTVEIDSIGQALVYRPATPNLPGTETFTYTIGDESNSMTARVAVKLIPSCLDWDGDGYGAYCDLGEDCDTILPYVWTTEGCASCGDNDGDGYYAGCDFYGASENPEMNFNTPGPDCDDDVITGSVCHEGCSIYYQDNDGDGHGDPDVTTTACILPTGYAESDDDCDPTDAAHFNDCGVCVDNDGDDYGVGCDLGSDCDDVLSAGAGCHDTCTAFYDDSDGDGYGDITISLDTCLMPTAFTADNSDCDTTSADHWADCGSCTDTDGDDYGVSCDLGADCDDDLITGAGCHNTCSAFYDDTDGDGYGDILVSVDACIQPVGYLADNTDCDTASAAHWSDCSLCTDNDSDNYGVSCDLGSDCDDDPITGTDCHNTCSNFYDDTDNDGYGDNSLMIEACTTPVNYLTDNTDCDPSNSMLWHSCGTCVDVDGDDYGAGCDSGTDCDDSLATGTSCSSGCGTFYFDSDGDGYGVTATSAIACVVPVGYTALSGDFCDSDNYNWTETGCNLCSDSDSDHYGVNCDYGADCDDADPFNWTVFGCTNCYDDADEDGYLDNCDAYTAAATEPIPRDYCDNDGFNWTEDGCALCIDWDGDGRGPNCDSGEDCTDFDITLSDCITETRTLFEQRNEWSPGVTTVALFAAEINGFTGIDVIFANSGSDDIGITLNLGGGFFDLGTVYSISPGTAPVDVVAADFDGDGWNDVATANNGTDNIAVLITDSGGSTFNGFFAPVVYDSGSEPNALFADDFDGDGFKDIAVVNNADENVTVFINDGFGGFVTDPTSYPVGADPRSIFAGDLNLDGLPDLTVANSSGNSISVLLNTGLGTFGSQTVYSTEAGPVSHFAADFDGDGFLDIATANNLDDSVGVMINNGSGGFPTQTTLAVDGTGPSAIWGGDMDGDGFQDIAVVKDGSSVTDVFINQGDGTLAIGDGCVSNWATEDFLDLVLADTNEDDKLDILYLVEPCGYDFFVCE